MSKKPRWGLIPAAVHKTSREMVDYDYLKQLSPEDLDWLDRFSREYYNDAYNTEPVLHSDPETKRKQHATHNARRRDLWNEFRRMPFDYTETIQKKDDGNDD